MRSFAAIPTAALRAEYDRRIAAVMRERERAHAQVKAARARLRELDALIGKMGQRTVASGRRVSLTALLRELLNGRVLSVADMLREIAARGYRSKANNPDRIVWERLRDRQFFRRVTRGRYTAVRGRGR